MSIYVSVGGINLSGISYLCMLLLVNRRFAINFSEVCTGASRQRVCKPVMFHSFYQRVLRKQWVLSRYRLHGSWIIYATTQNIHQKAAMQGVGYRLRLSRIGICFKSDAHVKAHDVTVMFFRPMLHGQPLLSVLLDAAELHKHQHIGSIHTLSGLLTHNIDSVGHPAPALPTVPCSGGTTTKNTFLQHVFGTHWKEKISSNQPMNDWEFRIKGL